MNEFEVEGLTIYCPLSYRVTMNLMESDKPTFDGTETLIRVTLHPPKTDLNNELIHMAIKGQEVWSHSGILENTPVYVMKGNDYLTIREGL